MTGEVHANSGLENTIDLEAIMNATLDVFKELAENQGKTVIVVKEGEDYKQSIMECLRSNPSFKNVAFFYCTEFLNQYKALYAIFNNVQVFYGSYIVVSSFSHEM